MPRTVNEGFVDFHTKLTPSGTETEAAKTHRDSIEACLKSNFGMKRLFQTGSFGNATSISGYSDVDYFAEIPPEKLRQDSGRSLIEIREALVTRFPKSDIRVSCPAVQATFGTADWDTTEVTPADYIGTPNQIAIYDIPDCAGGWMKSSPEVHNAYVRGVDNKLGGKVKPLIRFIKAWKYFNQVPITSFYLELRITKYAEGESSILYSIDVLRVFSWLSELDLAQMQDPKGISGYISACATSAKLEDAKSKLATALSRAQKAREAEEKKKDEDAFYWWRLLFNGEFPSYYR